MDLRQDAVPADRRRQSLEEGGPYELPRPDGGHDLPTQARNLPTPGLKVRVLERDRHWLPQEAGGQTPELLFEAAESHDLCLRISHVPLSIG